MRGRHLLSRPLACGACRRVFPAPLAARWAPISKAPLLAGARARSSVRSLGGDESAGESLPGHVPEWGLPSELKKTKVALHLGYDGSQYKGLQINRESSAGQTVEHFLEQAIYQVGGIRDSNMGDLTKIGWSRASRTDKGVHSLASVVALKMLCPDREATFLQDPEGLQLATSINRHLPSNIRVLSCQRVPKSFRARQQAASRRYEYFLPAWVIGITGEDAEEDARRLKLLREALRSFQGTHAFHNHTTMGLYSAKNNQFRHKTRKRKPHYNRPKPEEETGSSQHDECEASDDAPAVAAALAPESVSSADEESSSGEWSITLDESSDLNDEGAAEAGSGVRKPWDGSIKLAWSPDSARSVENQHYRHMRELVASDPYRLVDGGVLIIKISLWGDSYMLHQIRKMVGTACGVAVGVFRLELAAASLAPAARINLPMILAETLVLKEISFFPFPGLVKGEASQSSAATFTGETLELKDGGNHMLEAFRKEVLNQTLDTQLSASNWQAWAPRLASLQVDLTELECFLWEWREWQVQSVEAKKARTARRAEIEAFRAARAAAAEPDASAAPCSP